MIHRCLICKSEKIENYYVFTQPEINEKTNRVREKRYRIGLPFCEPCHDKDKFMELAHRFARAEFDRLDFQSVVDRYCESLENQFK